MGDGVVAGSWRGAINTATALLIRLAPGIDSIHILYRSDIVQLSVFYTLEELIVHLFVMVCHPE